MVGSHPTLIPTPSPSRSLPHYKAGLLLAQIERDTKPLEAALDAMLDLVARLGRPS